MHIVQHEAARAVAAMRQHQAEQQRIAAARRRRSTLLSRVVAWKRSGHAQASASESAPLPIRKRQAVL